MVAGPRAARTGRPGVTRSRTGGKCPRSRAAKRLTRPAFAARIAGAALRRDSAAPEPPMLPDRLQRALGRLDAALDALEAAGRRAAAPPALEQRCARLALERDAALSRCEAVERTVDDVSGRLAWAGAAVRGIMAELGEAHPGRDAPDALEARPA